MSTRSSSRIAKKAEVKYVPEAKEEGSGEENVQPKRAKAKPKAAVKKKPVKKEGTSDEESSPPPKLAVRGRRKQPVKKEVKSEEESGEEDVKPVKRKKANKNIPDAEERELAAKKLKIETKTKSEKKANTGVKLKVPVDEFCVQRTGDSHVYIDGEGVWNAMLNQTNVGSNNNKYYLVQLLATNSGGAYYTWFRWGRVGYAQRHQNKLTMFHSADAAKKDFCKKFKDKTKNDWYERAEFEKYPNLYDLLEMDYSVKDDEVETDGVKQEDYKSMLEPRLLSFIELISNVKTMEKVVMDMNFDVKKSPLGKLSKEQIKSGYEALQIIEECIRKEQVGSKAAREACSAFYTRIPHCFGFTSPPMLITIEDIKAKMDLLDALVDIEAAMKIIKHADKNEHKSDAFYHNLNCKLEPVEHDSDLFKTLEQYLQNTHGDTHNHYSLEVVDIFEVDRQGESERFKDVGNKQLLWHGSRLTNYGGILSSGLRIAPPEAPVTGYMFGKGVYFADMVSKSANYCFTTRANNTGILLLGEVALGTPSELLTSNYDADKLPQGKQSTLGLGKTGPDPAQSKMLGDVKLPMGRPVQTGVVNPQGYTLQYNEYIVYDVAQIKLKYALRVKFNYKR